jgi:hypothetical protein
MEAAGINSLLRVHPKVDHVRDGLQHRIDDRPS